MKTNMPVITAGETAYMLRAKLGPIRSWADFLADNIRGKQDIAGHRLMPCARKQDNRAFRPVYAVCDIEDFIAKVLAAVPEAGKTHIKPTILNIDTGRYWRINKFGRDGSPVIALHSIGSTTRHGHARYAH